MFRCWSQQQISLLVRPAIWCGALEFKLAHEIPSCVHCKPQIGRRPAQDEVAFHSRLQWFHAAVERASSPASHGGKPARVQAGDSIGVTLHVCKNRRPGILRLEFAHLPLAR